MSEAITWFFDNEEDGIILEDDCLPNESFFYYCEELLDRYKDNEKIMSICGSHFGSKYSEYSYYFSHFFDPWGWATWKRAWKYFDLYLERYNYDDFSNTIDKIYTNDLKFILIKIFAKNTFKTFSNIKKSKEVDSWALPWSICMLTNEGICIYPNVNLMTNIGYGEDSAHCFNENDPLSNNKNYNIGTMLHPKDIIILLENEEDKFTHRFFSMSLEDYIEYLESRNEELIELKNKFQYYVDKIAWWIPIRKWRDNFRENIYRTEQNRTEQNRTIICEEYIYMNNIIINNKLQPMLQI